MTSTPIWPPCAAQDKVADESSYSMNSTTPVAEKTGRMKTSDIAIAAMATNGMNLALLFTYFPLEVSQMTIG